LTRRKRGRESEPLGIIMRGSRKGHGARSFAAGARCGSVTGLHNGEPRAYVHPWPPRQHADGTTRRPPGVRCSGCPPDGPSMFGTELGISTKTGRAQAPASSSRDVIYQAELQGADLRRGATRRTRCACGACLPKGRRPAHGGRNEDVSPIRAPATEAVKGRPCAPGKATRRRAATRARYRGRAVSGKAYKPGRSACACGCSGIHRRGAQEVLAYAAGQTPTVAPGGQACA